MQCKCSNRTQSNCVQQYSIPLNPKFEESYRNPEIALLGFFISCKNLQTLNHTFIGSGKNITSEYEIYRSLNDGDILPDVMGKSNFLLRSFFLIFSFFWGLLSVFLFLVKVVVKYFSNILFKNCRETALIKF